MLQGRDDLAGPGGVPPAPVGLEPGVNPCPAYALQVGWSGPDGDGPPGRRRAPGQGPITALRVGRDLGERLAPDPALGLVDLAGQVQVEASRMLSAAVCSSEVVTALRV